MQGRVPQSIYNPVKHATASRAKDGTGRPEQPNHRKNAQRRKLVASLPQTSKHAHTQPAFNYCDIVVYPCSRCDEGSFVCLMYDSRPENIPFTSTRDDTAKPELQTTCSRQITPPTRRTFPPFSFFLLALAPVLEARCGFLASFVRDSASDMLLLVFGPTTDRTLKSQSVGRQSARASSPRSRPFSSPSPGVPSVASRPALVCEGAISKHNAFSSGEDFDFVHDTAVGYLRCRQHTASNKQTKSCSFCQEPPYAWCYPLH